MLFSVTLHCQVTKIVMNSGSQLSELKLVSQMSQDSGIVIVFVLSLSLSLSLYFVGQAMSPHHSDQMSQRSQVSRVAL